MKFNDLFLIKIIIIKIYLNLNNVAYLSRYASSNLNVITRINDTQMNTFPNMNKESK